MCLGLPGLEEAAFTKWRMRQGGLKSRATGGREELIQKCPSAC